MLETARVQRVTQLVIGRPVGSRLGEIARGGSMVGKLVRRVAWPDSCSRARLWGMRRRKLNGVWGRRLSPGHISIEKRSADERRPYINSIVPA